MFQALVRIRTGVKGLHLITNEIKNALPKSLPQSGFVHLFLRHTSASLIIQENSDPTARADLEEFMERLAPQGEAWHTHTIEGLDDCTSHMKSAVLPTQLLIPIFNGQLALGTWQGIYLWEHRESATQREILVSLSEG